MPAKKELTEEQELAIINDNLENYLSLNRIHQKYNISDKRIKQIFHKYGLNPIKNIHKGKYSFDTDFFKQDSEFLAYFLGWMCSDGFIQNNTNLIAIEIKQSDGEILEEIKKSMNYDRPISYFSREKGNGKFAKLTLENKYVKQLLINKYGIVPNKSSLIDFCFKIENLSKIYWKDFIRGYFDGDGSIKKTKESLTFQIDSTSLKQIYSLKEKIEELVFDEFKEKISLSISISHKKGDKNSGFKHNYNIYRLYCYGKKAEKVFFILYNKSNIYLKRKYDRYKNYVK